MVHLPLLLVINANENIQDTSSSKTFLYISSPSSYAVPQGGKFRIYGGGFTSSSNTIHIGDTSYDGIIPSKGALELAVPVGQAKGKFALSFSNSKGKSNTTFIVITEPNAIAPKVTTFTPTSGMAGTMITVTGENFSKEWNDIEVGSKPITGIISQDGKTLSFTATLPLTNMKPTINNKSFPLWFYIINPNGVSGPSVFTLKI